MKFLATGVYRPWYWKNYKDEGKQERLRLDWLSVASAYSYSDIKQGLAQWVIDKGVSNPPTPGEFFIFLAPKHTDTSRYFLSKARSIVSK
jgi:hypothetical protein